MWSHIVLADGVCVLGYRTALFIQCLDPDVGMATFLESWLIVDHDIVRSIGVLLDLKLLFWAVSILSRDSTYEGPMFKAWSFVERYRVRVVEIRRVLFPEIWRDVLLSDDLRCGDRRGWRSLFGCWAHNWHCSTDAFSPLFFFVHSWL